MLLEIIRESLILQWIVLLFVIVPLFVLVGCFVVWLFAKAGSQHARDLGWPEEKIQECESVNTSSFGAALRETFRK